MTIAPRYMKTSDDFLTSSMQAQMYRNDDAFSSASIFLHADPWPWSVDTNGESYPGDIVGVRYFDSPTAGDANNETMIAVPSELPSGYTQSWLRDHLHSKSFESIPIGMNTFPTDYGISDLRIGDPTSPVTVYKIKPPSGGITPYIWMPENRSNIAQYAVVVGSLFPGAGYRYIGFDFLVSGGSAWTWRARFKRGSTVLYEFIDTTAPPPGPAVRVSSPIMYHDGGANDFYAPTLGTRETTFNVTFEIDTGGGYADGNAAAQDFHFISGPRLDIPLPFVVTGTTVHAPGGIVTGSVPGY